MYMAGQADGSIIVDTELNSEGFKAGSAELQRAVRLLGKSVNSLGPTFQKALGGSKSAIVSFNAKAAALENTIAELEAKMAALGDTPIESSEYQSVCAELDRVSAKLDQLTAKRDKMHEMGVSEESKQYQSLIYDLTELESKYLSLNSAKTQMENSGTAYQVGSQTAEYQRLSIALSEAKNKLAEMNTEAGRSRGSFGSAVGKLVSGLKSAISHTAKLISSNKKYKNSFGGVLSSISRIGPALLAARGIMGILRKAVNAYMQANEECANTLSNCWTSIGNLLGPIITRLVNLVATAVAYFTAFMNLLGFTGKAASSAISGAGGSAKKETDKLKRQLASFDDLNILNDNSSDSGGGGGGTDAAAGLTSVELPDWVNQMVDQLKAGNWSEASTILTNELNSMIARVNWAGIGDSFGYYMNGALTFLATALLTFDWFSLGADLATGFNHILSSVDWGNLGVLLAAKWIVLIEGLGGIFATVDWAGLGKALADAFMGLWNSINWAQAAKTISDGVLGALNGIGSAIKNLDWHKLGSDLWNSIVDIVTNIDWGGLISTAFDLLGAALGGVSALVMDFAIAFWESCKAGFETVKNQYFAPYMNEMGEMTVEGFFQGIWDMICDIGSWIYNNIFTPFINGFKAAFGIHSPSTVMQEQGNFIIQGLLNGITAAWSSITGFFSNALSTVKATLSNAWSSIKSTASTMWSSIKTNITTTWANISTAISGKISSIKSTISTGWNNMKSTISSTVSTISSTISSKWSSISSTISSKISSVKNTVSSGFNTVKNSITSKLSSAMSTIKNQGWSGVGSAICTGIGNGISNGWSWLKNKVSSVANSLLSAAKKALGIHSPSRLFRDAVGLNIGYGIGEGIANSESSVVNTVSGVADAIAEEFNSNSYSIGKIGMDSNGNVIRGLDSFSETITNSFTSLLDRLQAIAESVTFNVPSAVGGIVPYHAATVAASGTSSNIEGALNANNDELISVIVQSITGQTAALVNALQAYGGTTVNFDKEYIADVVIKEINLRTRRAGTSPILI